MDITGAGMNSLLEKETVGRFFHLLSKRLESEGF
jgi:hypothetical protein